MAIINLGTGGSYTHLNGEWWPELFSAMGQISQSTTKATYKDDGGNKIVIEGSDFDHTGNVVGLSIFGSDGELVMSVDDLGITYKKIDGLIKSSWIVDVVAGISAGDDMITGTGDDDELMVASNAGNDTILGMGGSDFFRGGPGNNTMDGGNGYDVLSYHTDWWSDYQPKHGIKLDVAAGSVTNPWGGHDEISNFEKYQGTSFADVMLGSNADEVLVGFKGADTINGRDGVDTVLYYDDIKYGGMDGIDANLQDKTIVDGFGKTDTVLNVENVIGTKFADTITGSDDKNMLDGKEGRDVLTGGNGADTFVFGTGYGKDEITDLGKGADEVDLRTWTAIDNLKDLKAHASNHGDNVWITAGGDTLIIDHMQKNDLPSHDFHFA